MVGDSPVHDITASVAPTTEFGRKLYAVLFEWVPKGFFESSFSVVQVFGLLGVVYALLFVLLRTVSARRRTAAEYSSATYKQLAKNGRKTKFGNVFDRASVSLSVVVPAYNETGRIQVMLDDAIKYLVARQEAEKGFTFEVIVVDDGSKDGTSEFVNGLFTEYMRQWGPKLWTKRELRVLTMPQNRGKGGAVSQGIYVSRGELILFADADGATEFADLDKVEAKLRDNVQYDSCVAIGSRAHLTSGNESSESESSGSESSGSNKKSTKKSKNGKKPAKDEKDVVVVKRSPLRTFLMHGFHLVVRIVGVSQVQDTQCGFKLFTRRAAQMIVPNMHCERWIFDIELLLIAIHIGIPIVEVPVSWHEVDGTKISLVRDSVLMLIDLVLIRANYLLRVWRVQVHPPPSVSERRMRQIRMQVQGVLDDDDEALLVGSDEEEDYEQQQPRADASDWEERGDGRKDTENDYSEEIPEGARRRRAGTRGKGRVLANSDVRDIEDDF